MGCENHRMKKQICIKFALRKYVASMSFAQLCTQCKCGDSRICPFLCKFGHRHLCTGCEGRICPFLCKFGHRHLCTGCKALRISYLHHICTRQIWGKFDFSSSEHIWMMWQTKFKKILKLLYSEVA